MGHALFLSEADLIALSNNPLPKEGIPHDAHLHRPHRCATVVEDLENDRPTPNGRDSD